MTGGACLGVEDSEVLLAHAELLDQKDVFGLRGSQFDVTIFQSRIGAGLGLRRIEFARLRGDGSPNAWTIREAEREVDLILLRARTEMLLDERRHAPFSWLAKNAALVLGDFSEVGRRRLEAIRLALRREGYLPVLADEIEDIPQQTIREKVLTLASVCRFVVVDDSSRSGHLTEMAMVEQVNTPTIVLRLKGSFSSSMTLGIEGPTSNMKLYQYDEEILIETLKEGITWVEELIERKERYFNQEYRSWRTSGNKPSADLPYGISPYVKQSDW
jgi:hypothetical protein